MITKLTPKIFYKILKEELSSFFLGEEDIDTMSQDSSEIINKADALLKYTDVLSQGQLQVAQNEINYCLSKGKSTIDYNLYQRDKTLFLYITDYLALEAKNGNEKAQGALMDTFGLFQKNVDATKHNFNEKYPMSAFYSEIKLIMLPTKINRNPGEKIDTKTETDIDNFTEAFFPAITSAIKNFNPQKSNFNNYFSNIFANRIVDEWRKDYYVSNGETLKKVNSHLEDKLSTGDDDSATVGDTIAANDMGTEETFNRNTAKQIVGAMHKFFLKAFERNPRWQEFYKLYSVEDKELDEIASDLGITYQNARKIKFDIEKFINLSLRDRFLKFMESLFGERIALKLFRDKLFLPRMPREEEQTIRNNSIRRGHGGLEEVLTISGDKIIIDCEKFHNPYESSDIKEYSDYVINEVKTKLNSINKIYNQLNGLTSMLNEGQEVDVMDLYEQIKIFVEEAVGNKEKMGIIMALYEELHKIDDVAFDVQNEYNDIATEIKKTIEPMVHELEMWPNKLKTMLYIISKKYNPKSAYGL